MTNQYEIENLLELPDDVLLARLASPRTPRLEWAAVSAVLDQRNREEDTASDDTPG